MSESILAIPNDLLEAIRLPTSEKLLRLRHELAIRLYQTELLTFGKARQLAKMSKWEFHELLGKENITRHYDVTELETDLETLEKLASVGSMPLS
jgi:predicted HTH domain antitoxin